MKPFFERQALKFCCTRCGKCCETAGDYFVYLTRAEAERICAYLELTPAWFSRHYLERLEDGEQALAAGRDERCIFLDTEGQCKVYPVRPMQCSTYPFWPELVNNRRSWKREAARCEGIDQGDEVSIDRINKAIRRCNEQQE